MRRGYALNRTLRGPHSSSSLTTVKYKVSLCLITYGMRRYVGAELQFTVVNLGTRLR
jgi:hypothetical protein